VSFNILDRLTSVDEKLDRLNKLMEILIKTISSWRIEVPVQLPYPQPAQAPTPVQAPAGRVVTVVNAKVAIKDIMSVDVKDSETFELPLNSDIVVLQADGGTIYIQKDSTVTSYNVFKLYDGMTMIIYPASGQKVYVRSASGTVKLNIIKMEVVE